MMKLAIKGGQPVRAPGDYFPQYNTIGIEEKKAVMEVLDTGNLSQFLGAWHPDYYGGPSVRNFEDQWKKKFGVHHATSVNSNTSGLFAAIGACGIQPGDEVIVSPYTMSASAVAPLIYGGIPVFADISPETFCMTPESIREKITPLTKAILIVHIFGNCADMDAVMEIAREHNLFVIEDAAQAPGATYKGKLAGTIGDLGVYSLNYHKHIHTGEGGVVVTNKENLSERIQLIRNHGENLVGPREISDLTNHWGYNYRMTEIEAAIGTEQLKKLDGLLEERIANVEYLEAGIKHIDGLTMPFKSDDVKHVYYVHAIRYDKSKFRNVHRNDFVNAMKAELPSAHLRETTPLMGAGYVKPQYLSPLYQKRSHPAYHWNGSQSQVDYSQGICPVTEQMHYHELFTHEYIRGGMSKSDLDQVIEAFNKVANNIGELA
jgi:dTDP-4-amino-4,6-dideoxygalactose transaminase